MARDKMIRLEEALDIVLGKTFMMDTERIGFQDSLNRVLAEDVLSDINMPPFDKSAMDGFACKKEDLNGELEIIETIAAGQYPVNEVKKGECARIMTGAPIPKGADCVIMVEHCSINGDIVRFNNDKTNNNICLLGEDIQLGEKVLSKGMTIDARHIASMASVGCIYPLVYKKPNIGVLSTGDELVEASILPEKGQIRNSNGYQLCAQVEISGAKANFYGIIKDTKEETYKWLSKAIEENDIVLLTGGVSMGDFDFVPEMIEKAGLEILFNSLAVQPGRPTTFASNHKDKICFGLPGNPVSSFIQFEILVKESIYKMTGRKAEKKCSKCNFIGEYKRKKNVRQAYLPMQIVDEKGVKILDYNGSAHINSLLFADGFVIVPIGVNELKEGDIVDVRFI